MDKTATPKLELPKLDLAKLTMPKFDFDAFVALQKANIETVVAAQKIWFDLAQAVAKRNADLVKEVASRMEVLLKGGFDARKQPAAYVDEAKAVLEKAVADAQETVDLGVKAQHEVVELLVKRASANFDHVKTLAA